MSSNTKKEKEQAVKKDRYGFIHKHDAEVELKPPSWLTMKENTRLLKWRKMVVSDRNKYRIARSQLFIKRVKKGIPDSIRGAMWAQFLVDIQDSDRAAAEDFIKRAPIELEKDQSGLDALECINKDLHRTFPSHAKFQNEDGIRELFAVLAGYALSDPEVGYCQGMSFVAALFLMYENEVDALCVLRHVMNKPNWNMRDMFKPSMSAISLRFFQYDSVLKRACRRVHAHFRAMSFEPSHYSTQWFATIFSYNFPFAFVVRIWDAFLLEGWPIVISAAVAFWRHYQKLTLNLRTFESLFDQMKRFISSITHEVADKIMKDAHFVSRWYCTSETLIRLEHEYEATKTS